MKRGIKRLYDRVSVARRAAGEFMIHLDGRPLKTPKRDTLLLPTEPLAFGIALEWEMQGTMIRPDTMPLMKLATTTIDQVAEIRPTMTDSMLRHLRSDMVCFRSLDEPKLMAREERHFAPLLDWLKHDLEIELATSTDLTLRHPPFSMARAEILLDEADDWEISALDFSTNACKSFAIALALCRNQIGAEEALTAARVAEQYQIDEWGEARLIEKYNVIFVKCQRVNNMNQPEPFYSASLRQVEAGHDLDAADLAVRLSAASTFMRMLRC
ncbi:MAG: hypothetical protein SGPRY_009508 [Prymnesium sp.]